MCETTKAIEKHVESQRKLIEVRRILTEILKAIQSPDDRNNQRDRFAPNA